MVRFVASCAHKENKTQQNKKAVSQLLYFVQKVSSKIRIYSWFSFVSPFTSDTPTHIRYTGPVSAHFSMPLHKFKIHKDKG